MRCLLLCLPLAVSSAQEPYVPHVEEASEEGTEAMKSFALREGFAVDLYAAEPMLANPVCLYVDHSGDLYVGETFRHYAGVADIRDHMDWLDDDLASRTVEDRRRMFAKHEGEEGYATYATEAERLRLIRDTDGDGKPDEAIVFAEGFNDHAAGIGAGVLSRKGDVYYTCIPDLWLLRDRDGDGVAEERIALSSGYGVNVALLGHDLHGLRIGPDGRLYFSSGDRGFHVETENGPIAHHHTGAVLRCNLDGTGLEVWHSGLRNPQELVFDEFGNLFTGDNNSDGGDKARWVNIVEGGESGWRYSYQWITSPNLRGPWNDEKIWYPPHEGQAAYVVPPIANLANGPSGLTYYPGTGFGPGYDGTFFLCDFRGAPSYSGVLSFKIQARGAFWEMGEVHEFAWNTLATDVDFGPDGRLYFTDWVSGWNKTGKGRVYRVFSPEHVAAPLVVETRAILAAGFEGLTSLELERLLQHRDQRVRQEAQFELVDRGSQGASVLGRVAAGNDSLLARLHGIWGLGMSGRNNAGVLEQLLALCEDPDAEVRAQAIRVLGDERFVPAAPLAVELLGDDSARVRFFAAIAAGRLGAENALEPLRALIRECGTSDPNLRHAGVMGLLGCANDPDLLGMANDPSDDVRMAALLAMRRRASPAVAGFLTDASKPLLVVEAARAIHDLPIDGALPELAAMIDDPELEGNALVRRVLVSCLRLGTREGAVGLAAFAARADAEARHRVEALQHLTEWREPSPRDRVMGEWRPLAKREAPWLAELVVGLSADMAEAPTEVIEAYATLVVSAGALDTAPVLGDWLADRSKSAAARVACLRALADLGVADLTLAIDTALGDASGELRAAGLSELGRQDAEAVMPRLPRVLELGEFSERRTAYRILGRTRTKAAAALLAKELQRLNVELVPAELALDLVQAAEAQGDPVLDVVLVGRQARRAADPGVAAWLDTLFGGEVKRGRRVFERLDLSCVRCHSSESEGVEQVGPSLANVSMRLTRLQMLESILEPNRRTTPGYRGTVLFLEGGGTVAGRVLEENEEYLRVQLSSGEVEDVYLDEIEERRFDLSAMPNGLGDVLNRDDMRHLLAYLGSL